MASSRGGITTNTTTSGTNLLRCRLLLLFAAVTTFQIVAGNPGKYNGVCNDQICVCVVQYAIAGIKPDNFEATCPEWMKTTFEDGPYDTIASSTCIPERDGTGVIACGAYKTTSTRTTTTSGGDTTSIFQNYPTSESSCVIYDNLPDYPTNYTVGIFATWIVRDGDSTDNGSSSGGTTTSSSNVIVNYSYPDMPIPECPTEQPFAIDNDAASTISPTNITENDGPTDIDSIGRSSNAMKSIVSSFGFGLVVVMTMTATAMV